MPHTENMLGNVLEKAKIFFRVTPKPGTPFGRFEMGFRQEHLRKKQYPVRLSLVKCSDGAQAGT